MKAPLSSIDESESPEGRYSGKEDDNGVYLTDMGWRSGIGIWE